MNAKDLLDEDWRKLWEYKGFRWGGGVCHLPKGFFLLKMEGASGFQTPSGPSEDSLELCLLQTGLAKNEKLPQTTSS